MAHQSLFTPTEELNWPVDFTSYARPGTEQWRIDRDLHICKLSVKSDKMRKLVSALDEDTTLSRKDKKTYRAAETKIRQALERQEKARDAEDLASKARMDEFRIREQYVDAHAADYAKRGPLRVVNPDPESSDNYDDNEMPKLSIITSDGVVNTRKAKTAVAEDTSNAADGSDSSPPTSKDSTTLKTKTASRENVNGKNSSAGTSQRPARNSTTRKPKTPSLEDVRSTRGSTNSSLRANSKTRKTKSNSSLDSSDAEIAAAASLAVRQVREAAQNNAQSAASSVYSSHRSSRATRSSASISRRSSNAEKSQRSSSSNKKSFVDKLLSMLCCG